MGEKRALGRKLSQQQEAREALKRQERRKERYEREGRILPVNPTAQLARTDEPTLALD